MAIAVPPKETAPLETPTETGELPPEEAPGPQLSAPPAAAVEEAAPRQPVPRPPTPAQLGPQVSADGRFYWEGTHWVPLAVQAPPVSVLQTVSPAPSVVVVQQKGAGLLVRAIYFLFIGWWLGAIASGVAWFLLITVIGLPLGLALINALPKIVTLRPTPMNIEVKQGVVVIGAPTAQFPWPVRAIYFLLVGWWASAIWMTVAYLAVLTVIGLPLAFVMYDLTPAITTLRKK